MHPYFQFPERLIQIIEELCLYETPYKTAEDFVKNFSSEIKTLSDYFNQKPSSNPISSTLSYKNFPIAYIAYFLPTNFFKVASLLLDFRLSYPAHPLFSPEGDTASRRSIRVLDLGSGPGTNGLGLLDFCSRFPEPFFENSIIEYVAVDHDSRHLHYFSRLYSSYLKILEPALSEKRIAFKIHTIPKAVLAKLPIDNKGFDIIILGNLLNEMTQSGHSLEFLAEWIKRLMNLLTSNGVLFIIEPALRKTSRNLLALRDLIASQKTGSIIAPCLHQHPCPILSPQGSENDWCHQEKEWEAPAWIQKIDRMIGNRKDSLKYSYLILSPLGKGPVHPPFQWRVVSELMESKGKKEVF
ncbi:MAG: small ribosomal subunit Rsm22 family protein, partial [Nitrospiria bacterium]